MLGARKTITDALLTEWPDWGREVYADAILAALDAAGYAVVPKVLPQEITNKLMGHFDNDVIYGYQSQVKSIWMDLLDALAASKQGET